MFLSLDKPMNMICDFALVRLAKPRLLAAPYSKVSGLRVYNCRIRNDAARRQYVQQTCSVVTGNRTGWTPAKYGLIVKVEWMHAKRTVKADEK